MRHIYSVIVGLLIGAMVMPVSAAKLDITFRPGHGDYITSGDFNTTWDEIEAVVNNLNSQNMTDSAVTAAKIAADAVGSLTISDAAVDASHLNYSDSSDWDTMPVKMYGGSYVGDSTAARRVSCGGIRPMRVEVQGYSPTSTAQFIFDERWDTTACLLIHPAGLTAKFVDTGVRITQGDTEFVVYHTAETDTDANYLGRVMLYTVWGY